MRMHERYTSSSMACLELTSNPTELSNSLPSSSEGRGGGSRRVLRRSCRAILAKRIVGFSSHATAPLRVEVPHPALVVDLHVLLATMNHPLAVRALAHGSALPMNAQQVFMQIAPERTPDGVVVADALGTLLRCVALRTQTTEFNDELVRA